MRTVTGLDSVDAPVAGVDLRPEAAARALHAADAARVSIRQVGELPGLRQIERLFDDIWRPDGNPPLGIELLRALSKAGNYVAGAFDGDELLGACVGFFAAPAGETLHSHIAGVGSNAQGRHVGYALKLDQRSWALARGVSTIEWTFDPLVSRNAYFNLVKLAGQPIEYLTNFYGGMHDGINGADDTDRLLLRWDLRSPEVVEACAGRGRQQDLEALRQRGATVALSADEHGLPLAGPGGSSGGAPTTVVAVPRDIESLRARDPGAAREWRVAVRDVLGGMLADGGRIVGFDRSGWYIVERCR